MLYLDDEARDDFNASSGMLQAVCSALEALLFQRGMQAELIMAEKHKAHIGLSDCPPEIASIILSELNAQCRGRNNKPVAEWLDESLGIVTIRVARNQDLRLVM